MSAKARQGCELHWRLHSAMHANPRTGRPSCPGCDATFENRLEAFAHLAAATDEAHMRHCIDQLLKKTLTTF